MPDPRTLVIAVSVTGILYGEADDAPGLQLPGVVLVVAVVYGVRAVRRSR